MELSDENICFILIKEEPILTYYKAEEIVINDMKIENEEFDSSGQGLSDEMNIIMEVDNEKELMIDAVREGNASNLVEVKQGLCNGNLRNKELINEESHVVKVRKKDNTLTIKSDGPEHNEDNVFHSNILIKEEVDICSDVDEPEVDESDQWAVDFLQQNNMKCDGSSEDEAMATINTCSRTWKGKDLLNMENAGYIEEVNQEYSDENLKNKELINVKNYVANVRKEYNAIIIKSEELEANEENIFYLNTIIKEEEVVCSDWDEPAVNESEVLAVDPLLQNNMEADGYSGEETTDCFLKSLKPVAVVTASSTPHKNDKLLLNKNEIKCFPPPLNISENHKKAKHHSTLELQNISSPLQDTTKPDEHLNEFQQVTWDTICKRENEDSDCLPSSDEDTNESGSDCNSSNKIKSKPKEKIYNTKSKVNEDNSSDRITLKSVEKDSSGRIVRNKGHCCLFCLKIMVNLPRHMELVHHSETEVAKLLFMEKNSIHRRNGFIELSRVGDYYHNCEVLEKKTGELILVRRPKPDEEFAFNKYSPCPDCLGFMLKKHLWHHVKMSCTSQGHRINVDNVKKQHRKVLAESKVLLESSLNRNIPSVFVEKILSRLRQDQVSEVCKEDELIINFGLFQFEKYGLIQSEMTRQYMRQLARLLIVLKENNHNKTKLSEWLMPECFDEIIDAVKKVCIQENPDSVANRPTYKIPSHALKLGHNIRKCIGIERGQALRVCNKEKNKQLKDLLNIMELEWTAKIIKCTSNHA